jgi:hypothetical protein
MSMARKRNTGNYLPMKDKKKNEIVPTDVEDYSPVHVEPMPEPVSSIFPSQVSAGELLTAAVLLYASSITAFNAGYFFALKGRFVELFSLADLVAINISILQYFVSVMFFYGLFMIVTSSAFPGLRDRVRYWIENLLLQLRYDNSRYWLSYYGGLAAFVSAIVLVNNFKISSFTLIILPCVLFQGFLLYLDYVGYKYQTFSVRSLAVATVLTIFIFSFNAGHAWLQSETRTQEGVQALFLQDGTCIERKLLRSSGNGMLLYNPSLESFEFRNKDSIKTIFDRKGCP